MNKLQTVYPTLLLLLFFFALALAIHGCSCYTADALDVELKRSENVAVARLEGFEELTRSVEGTRVYRTYAVFFTVEKVFKGGLKSSETIKLLDGGDEGVCTMGFTRSKLGDRFLFFMGQPRKFQSSNQLLHSVSICGRSKRLERAGADIEYLENLATMKGRTRLSGTVRAGGENIQLPSVAGLKVELDGPVRRSGLTKDGGLFEFWDLPPGEYAVTFGLPAGWKISSYTLVPSVEGPRRHRLPMGGMIRPVIAKATHTELNTFLDIDHQISGTVLSRDGKPVKDVCVSAFWLTPLSGGFTIPENCTDEQGIFRIKELPPGKYRLEITQNKRNPKMKPAKTFYYPGVYDKASAEPVSVDAGKSLEGLVIRLID